MCWSLCVYSAISGVLTHTDTHIYSQVHTHKHMYVHAHKVAHSANAHIHMFCQMLFWSSPSFCRSAFVPSEPAQSVYPCLDKYTLAGGGVCFAHCVFWFNWGLQRFVAYGLQCSPLGPVWVLWAHTLCYIQYDYIYIGPTCMYIMDKHMQVHKHLFIRTRSHTHTHN